MKARCDTDRVPVRMMSMLAFAIAPVLASAAAPPAGADDAAKAMANIAVRPGIAATRTNVAPVIDGRLNDLAWQSAIPSAAFTQKFPNEAKPPSETTAIRVLYDDDAVYVAFDCPQRRAPVVRRLARRDSMVESDYVALSIGTRGDETSAFEFVVSAAGVLVDGIRYDDTEYSSDWDEIWEGRSQTTSSGWSAEFRIPLRILRFDHAPRQAWSFQARRYISALQETEEWAYIPRSEAGEVSRYGRLIGLDGLSAWQPPELQTYLLGRFQWFDGLPPPVGGQSRFAVAAGMDLKWHVTPNLTLNATFNPDFAQVEVDRVLLNLTTYEVQLPEKRPFMLEGVDAFATPLQLLYTRRIGAAPPVDDVPFPVEASGPAPIYGALKLVGSVGHNVTLAALSALTGRSDALVLSSGSDRSSAFGGNRISTMTLSPLTQYSALRLKVPIGARAHVGIFGGAVARFEDGAPRLMAMNDTLLCADGAAVPDGGRCQHDVFVAAVDGRWRSSGGTYLVVGQAVLTALQGGPPRQMRDGTLLSSGDFGFGGILRLAKEGGRHWTAYVESEVAGRTLDYNDLGFMERQNLARVNAHVELRTLRPWWRTVESYAWVDYVDRETLSGLNLAREVWVGGRTRFANYWTVKLELYHRAAHFDDREVGNGVALERAAMFGEELLIATDPRNRFYCEFQPTVQVKTSGGYNLFFDGAFTLRVMSRMDVQLTPEFSMYTGEPRYVAPGVQADSYQFGLLRAMAAGATLRSTFVFTSQLTLQVYMQLFLAARQYDHFSLYSSDHAETTRAIRISDLRPSAAPASNPDSQETVLNASVVLRWEFMTGSTLYFVYTRAQSTVFDGEPSRLDPGALRVGTAANMLLLKLTYFWK